MVNWLKTWLKEKWTWLKENWDHIIGPAGAIAVVVSLLYVWLSSPLEIEAKLDITTAIAALALVLATSVYAWHTRRLSQANVQMAEAMKKQLMAARPFVIPDIDVHGNQKTYVENMRDLAQSYFPVAITNVGAATAIELELFLIAPKGNSISTKLPLLLQGGSWRNKLAYVYDFNENGEPIFDMPPPEGRYELKVKFRSAVAEEDMQFSEVTLPFDLQWSGTDFYWKIERHELNYTSLELKPK